MTGCRIGRVKPKNGCEIQQVITQPRTHFHNTVENAARSIAHDTHAMGFFILYDSGEVTSGISYNSGFTAAQLKGACEHMKDCLMDQVWGSDE